MSTTEQTSAYEQAARVLAQAIQDEHNARAALGDIPDRATTMQATAYLDAHAALQDARLEAQLARGRAEE